MDGAYGDVLVSLKQLAELPLLDIGPRIEVDTTCEPTLSEVVRAISLLR